MIKFKVCWIKRNVAVLSIMYLSFCCWLVLAGSCESSLQTVHVCEFVNARVKRLQLSPEFFLPSFLALCINRGWNLHCCNVKHCIQWDKFQVYFFKFYTLCFSFLFWFFSLCDRNFTFEKSFSLLGFWEEPSKTSK